MFRFTGTLVRLVSLPLAIAVAGAACAHWDTTDPARSRLPVAQHDAGPSSAGTPNFLQMASDAPTIANPVITFTVRRGQDTTVRMVYHRAHGGPDSVTFAEFRVRAQSLEAWPDGRTIADGEAVTITMTLVDPVHGIIDFQPSGLRFSAKHPASLKINYSETDHDLNGDGLVNFADTLLQRTIHMICRETPDSAWVAIPSTNDTEIDEVEAPIFGFTGYAIDFG